MNISVTVQKARESVVRRVGKEKRRSPRTRFAGVDGDIQ